MRLMSPFRRTSSLSTDVQSIDEQMGALDHASVIELDDPILGMAIRNEEIRQEFDGLMDQFHQIDLLKSKFTSTLTRFASVVNELEASRRETAELNTALDLEVSRSDGLRSEVARLEPEISSLLENVRI